MGPGTIDRSCAQRVPGTDTWTYTALMIAAPMLADFAIRLAFGLAVSTLMISWRIVPLPFFRTQAHVILGLLVLAAPRSVAGNGRQCGFLGRRDRRGPGILVGGGMGIGPAAVRPRDGRAGRARHGRLDGRRVLVGQRRPGDGQRLEPAHLGFPHGSHTHGDAARSLLPDRPGHDD